MYSASLRPSPEELPVDEETLRLTRPPLSITRRRSSGRSGLWSELSSTARQEQHGVPSDWRTLVLFEGPAMLPLELVELAPFDNVPDVAADPPSPTDFRAGERGVARMEDREAGRGGPAAVGAACEEDKAAAGSGTPRTALESPAQAVVSTPSSST